MAGGILEFKKYYRGIQKSAILHMPSLILLRGLPGSGKTTLARELSENGKYPVCSVDDFFTDASGLYVFKYEENHLAYRNCEEKTRECMEQGLPKVFVDNTFTLEWEMEPYFKMASRYGYRVHVVTVENRHHGSNVHGVNAEQMEKMASKYKVVLY